MKINNKIIETLIKDGDYEYLNVLLSEYFQNPNAKNRLYFNILKMTDHMKVIQNASYYNLPKVEYEYDYGLRRFYEALKGKDYQEAYKLSFDCIKYLTDTRQSTYEMYLYQTILKELSYQQKEKTNASNKKILIKNNISKLSTINKENKYLNFESIEEIKKIVNNILENGEETDLNCTQFIYILEIISMIETVIEYKCIDKTYFLNLNKKFETKPTFDELLYYGDYIRGYEYLKQKENRDFIISENNYLCTKIIFKLLKFLYELVQKNTKDKYNSVSLSNKIQESFDFYDFEKSIDLYMNDSIKKDEEVIAKLLILEKYSKNK